MELADSSGVNSTHSTSAEPSLQPLSPLKPQVWDAELVGDCDRDFLLDGVTHGFRLVDHGAVIESYACENYKSALQAAAKAKMDQLIQQEVALGMLKPVPHPPHCVHAIGCILKDSGGIRPITDCSRPEGLAINNFMSVERFSYNSVDTAACLMSKDCYFAIVDISSAYWHVPIHPDHWTYQGIFWDGQNFLSG